MVAPPLTPLQRLLQRSLLAYGRMTRAMTLGVRAMLLDGDAVLLVRHSYVPGWYLPGGGVERGETALDALRREIHEEAGAVLTEAPQLFGLYRNVGAHPRDHVALFVCRAWRQPSPPLLPNREIVACERFALDRLPDDTTRATRDRIAEVIAGRAVSPDW